MKNKPKIGEPCNACGLCCMNQICMNGAYVMRLVSKLGDTVKGPCPALVEFDNGFVCEIVLKPKKYIKASRYTHLKLSEAFAQLIGAGFGCDELGYDEPDISEERKLSELMDRVQSDPNWHSKTKQALKIIHRL